MQIALFCHVTFFWLTSFEWLLGCTLLLSVWEPYSFPLGSTGQISSCWQWPTAEAQGRTQEQGKYRERHLSFPLLSSDDQNLTSPSLRLASGGHIMFNRPWWIFLLWIYLTNSSTHFYFSYRKCCGVMSSTAEIWFMWKNHFVMLVLSHSSITYNSKSVRLSQSFH